MIRVGKFRKVERLDYIDSTAKTEPSQLSFWFFLFAIGIGNYSKLKLPKRVPKNSGEYNFIAPISFTLVPGQSIKFPTGIVCDMDDDVALMLFPRSESGFTQRLHSDNATDIIGADYGKEIWCTLTNNTNKNFNVKEGSVYMKGVFTSTTK